MRKKNPAYSVKLGSDLRRNSSSTGNAWLDRALEEAKPSRSEDPWGRRAKSVLRRGLFPLGTAPTKVAGLGVGFLIGAPASVVTGPVSPLVGSAMGFGVVEGLDRLTRENGKNMRRKNSGIFPSFATPGHATRSPRPWQSRGGQWLRTPGRRPNGRASSIDDHAVTELVLYADNNSKLYFGIRAAIIANLKKHIAKGRFEKAKAVKAFGYVADAAAKAYTQEFGEGRGFGIFSAATRRAAAAELLDGAMEELGQRKNGKRRSKRRSR